MSRPPSTLRPGRSRWSLGAAYARDVERNVDVEPAGRDGLVRANLRLVVTVARRYQGRGLDLPDLVQWGNLGLVRAAEKFDPAFPGPDGGPVRFATYAVWWIRAKIREGILGHADAIRVGRDTREQVARWDRYAAQHGLDVRAAPTPEALAAALGLGPVRAATVARAIVVRNAGHGNAVGWYGSPEEDPLLLAVDPGTDGHDRSEDRDDEARRLREAIAALPPRHAAVVRGRWGLDGREPASLRAVGAEFDCTAENARQIEADAIEKIRRHLCRSMHPPALRSRSIRTPCRRPARGSTTRYRSPTAPASATAAG